MRRRTLARELAVQFLYQVDLRGDEVLPELESFLVEATKDALVRLFATQLVTGTRQWKDRIDERLRAVTKNWDLKRMATIDRNVMRMAMYELMHCPDVPPKVAINEAIDIGKRFSTANSGAFINGILDRVRIDLEAERVAAPQPAPEPQQPAQEG